MWSSLNPKMGLAGLELRVVHTYYVEVKPSTSPCILPYLISFTKGKKLLEARILALCPEWWFICLPIRVSDMPVGTMRMHRMQAVPLNRPRKEFTILKGRM